VGAHPDDETSSAALLARAKELSGSLYMATLTRGENSDKLWAGLKRGDQVGEARAALFKKSAALLKADAVDIGPFVNGPRSLEELEAQGRYQDWGPAVAAQLAVDKWSREGDPVIYLAGLIRRWRPDVIVSMDGYCGVSGNDEHIAAARILDQAIRAAADPREEVPAGMPWRVDHQIFTAKLLPRLEACGQCKCEGPRPQEPVERMSTLENSKLFNKTYFAAGCLVSKSYQNQMEKKGRWSEDSMLKQCLAAETAARRAREQGRQSPLLDEPYRVRLIRY
jgi:LmbE family N-acetylglucosaminyl deacetylase